MFLLISCQTSKKGVLSWQEKFNKKEIDFKNWSKIPRGTPDWNNYMSDFDSCYSIRNGKLILRGIVNNTLKTDTATFLTGGVYTKGKKEFTTGRLEIKAKFTEATGAWPAIWMLPREAKWPKGGEIDIMEHLNYDDIVYQTVHSNYTVNLNKKNKPRHSYTGKIKRGKFNVYAVEIRNDSLSFFINGKHTFTYPKIKEADKTGQFEFTKQPFYLMLNMQLGGSWVGKVNPQELPAEMEIDWVRYYKAKE